MQEAESELQIKEQQLLWCSIQIQELTKSLNEARAYRSKMQDLEMNYNLIDFPEKALKDIETRMTLIDETISGILIDYLKRDSYELVKNMARVTDSQNASNVIAYRDGALGRNEALITTLSNIKTLSINKQKMKDKAKLFPNEANL